MPDCHTTFLKSNFHCSKMAILWASCTMGFLRCPGFRKIFFLNLHKCTYLVNESDCSNLCIEYKYVVLLQSIEKKITIFLSVGILEHSPLHTVHYTRCLRKNCAKLLR